MDQKKINISLVFPLFPWKPLRIICYEIPTIQHIYNTKHGRKGTKRRRNLKNRIHAATQPVALLKARDQYLVWTSFSVCFHKLVIPSPPSLPPPPPQGALAPRSPHSLGIFETKAYVIKHALKTFHQCHSPGRKFSIFSDSQSVLMAILSSSKTIPIIKTIHNGWPS